MVEVAKCKCGGDAKLHGTIHKRFISCAFHTDCWVGPARDTEAEAIAAWNALMAPTPAPDPAAGTVRVRMPVGVDENGYVCGDFCVSFTDASDNYDPGDNEMPYVVVATFPRQHPTEITGTVENEND